jgi:hypothetical protein
MTTNTVEEPGASIFISTLKMEVPYSSESVHTLQDIWTFLTFLLDESNCDQVCWSSVLQLFLPAFIRRGNRCPLKADSHIACRAHAVPLPCRAAKGLECVFPIWFTQCGRVWFTLPCRAHALLRPCLSSQGHGTGRPPRDDLWATVPRSTSSGYHAQFRESCYQKYTNLRCRWPVWSQITFVMGEEKSASSTLQKKDALLNCWARSSDISDYHADFHEGHGTVGAGQGRGMACVN